MTEAAQKLKDELAALPEQDRLELADFLLGTVEVTSTDDETEWDAELERRWHEIKDGTAQGASVEEVNARLREKYS
jgi:putative addiction module component (TIGR02574 family)